MRLETNNQILQTFRDQSLGEGSEQIIRGNPISNKWVPIQNLLSGVLFSDSLPAFDLSRPTAFSVGALLLFWTLEEIPMQPGAEEDSVFNHRHRTELHNFPPIKEEPIKVPFINSL